MPSLLLSAWTKSMQFAGKCNRSTAVSTGVDGLSGKATLASARAAPVPQIELRLCALSPVENRSLRLRPARLYWLLAAVRPGGASSSFSTRETDLSAQRAQAEAKARLPRADGDAGRPRDPQAQARQGPEAPLRVASGA